MKAIFHCDKNWGIGKANGLMFKIPKDMKFFRDKTKNNIVVMGYNTMLSFGEDPKPLKNRKNIVLSSRCDKSYEDKGFIIVRNFDELKAVIKDADTDSVYIIGGASLYNAMLPYCTDAYVTKVDADGDADTFVTNLDNEKDWVIANEPIEEIDNGYKLKFLTYHNNNQKKF